MLGRETAIQKVIWSQDGWLRLAAGGHHPLVNVPAPEVLPWTPWPEEPVRDEFDAVALSPHWNSLRMPIDESWATLRERRGWLRLRGRESLHSIHEQSLVARRLQAFHVVAETCLQFEPTHFTQMAGLICWYDTKTHFYLRVTHDETSGKVLGVVLTDDGVYRELTDSQIAVGGWWRCFLRAEIDHDKLQFFASPEGETWQSLGPVLDASKLSDDYGGKGLHFTGAFIGLCAQDLGGMRTIADFNYFGLSARDEFRK
jgi:xylan 1,4-beta-xylosidase